MKMQATDEDCLHPPVFISQAPRARVIKITQQCNQTIALTSEGVYLLDSKGNWYAQAQTVKTSKFR